MRKLLIILVLLSSVVYAQRGPTMLQLLDSVRVASADVTLGDLVVDSTVLPNGWASRLVMKAPPAGEVSYHALTAIAYALQRYPDMKSVMLQGEPVVSIQRKDRRLERTELEEPIREHLTSTDPWKGRKLEVKVLSLPNNTRIPVGKTSYRVVDIDKKTAKGYSLIYVEISVDNEVILELPAGVEIQELTEVWVLRQSLSHGHILTADDLRREQRVVDATEQYVSSDEDLVGYELSRSLAAGSLVSNGTVRKPLCIRRGDWVAINAFGGSLHVTLRGKALANGRLGERIMCLNERSQRKVLVELTGDGQARLVRM